MQPDEEYDRLSWPMMTSCRVCGFLPDRAELEGRGRGPRARALRAHRLLVILLVGLIFAGLLADVVVFFGEDMNETIECALIGSVFYMSFTRTVVFAGHQRELLYVLERMRSDWCRSSEEDRLILRDKCLLAFKLAKFFIVSVAMSSLLFSFMPIVELNFGHDAKRMLPYRGYFFYNHTLPLVYECTYVANTILGTLCACTICGGTSFCLIVTMHAAAKFAIVQKGFEKMDLANWSNNELVGRYVRQHQECIRFAESVESIINIIALAQFVTSTGLMCFAGFQLTTMQEDRARLMKYASFLNAATMELFIFSYSGQSLKSESEDVAECAYSSNWIGSLVSSNLRLIVIRSRKPCTITAGKFYDMSLESFLKVLSSSFSYFTVLIAMKEE